MLKKMTRIGVAAAMAISGLIAVAGVSSVASATTKATTTCYYYSATQKQVLSKVEKGATCTVGTYAVRANALLGSNLSGDLTLDATYNGTLNINGSSFDAPLISTLTSGSNAYSGAGNVNFSGYPAAGSGTGRSGICGGSLDIGFSDQPMAVSAGTNVSGCNPANYVQVPFLLGGAVVGTNIPGVKGVKLTAAEVKAIYNGDITQWSDPTLLKTNNGGTACGVDGSGSIASPYVQTSGSSVGATATAGFVACKGVALKLYSLAYKFPKGSVSNVANPSTDGDTIKVLYRNASSGTTYAFTDYIKAATGSLPTGGNASGNPMETNGWSAPHTVGVANNAAMASTLLTTPGGIGYVEYSYVLIPGNAAISVALLQDQAGAFIKPSLTNIALAASEAGSSITPEGFSIVWQHGKAWPLATYSWAIVPKQSIASNDSSDAAAVKFLDWAAHYGQSFAKGDGYVALPAAAAAYVQAQLASATDSSGTTQLTK